MDEQHRVTKVVRSELLENAQTPGEWVRYAQERNIALSERKLRREARQRSLCLKLGREILITPKQFDQIILAGPFEK